MQRPFPAQGSLPHSSLSGSGGEEQGHLGDTISLPISYRCPGSMGPSKGLKGPTSPTHHFLREPTR